MIRALRPTTHLFMLPLVQGGSMSRHLAREASKGLSPFVKDRQVISELNRSCNPQILFSCSCMREPSRSVIMVISGDVVVI
jgi:hypothetical protein